jgi:tetratricopeptide (TPR) repeat protein
MALLAVAVGPNADVADSARALEDAEACAEEGLAYLDALETSAKWKLLENLSVIAKVRGDESKGSSYRRRAREVYVSDERNRERVRLKLGSFLADMGRALGQDPVAKQHVLVALRELESSGSAIVAPIERMLQGETDWHTLSEGVEVPDAAAIFLMLEAAHLGAPDLGEPVELVDYRTEDIDFLSFVPRVKEVLPGTVRSIIDENRDGLEEAIGALDIREQNVVRAAMSAMNAHAWDAMMVALHSYFDGTRENREPIEAFIRMIDGGEGRVRRALDRFERGERDRAKVIRGLEDWEAAAVDKFCQLETLDAEHLPVRFVAGRLVGGSAELAERLNNLGVALLEASQPSTAEYFLEKAALLSRRLQGAPDPNAIRDMKNLAAAYSEQGKYERAEALWRRIVTLEESARPPDEAMLATDYGYMADVYFERREYSSAQRFYSRAIELTRGKRLIEPADHATNVLRLAECLFRLEQNAECQLLLEEEIGNLARDLGGCHTLVRQARGLLARQYEGLDRQPDAAEMWRTNVDCCARENQTAEDELGVYQENLGRCLLATAQYEEAHECFFSAVELFRGAFGINNDHTLIAVADLIAVHLHRGREADALNLTLAYVEETFLAGGVEAVVDCLDSVVAPLVHFGRYSLAETTLRRGVELIGRRVGDDRSEEIDLLSRLASVCMEDGRPENAAAYFGQRFELRSTLVGEHSPLLKDDLRAFALAQYAAGSRIEASNSFARLISLHDHSPGETKSDLLKDIQLLAKMRAQLGDLERAAVLTEESVAILHEEEHADPEVLGAELEFLLSLYTQLGRTEAAELARARVSQLGRRSEA